MLRLVIPADISLRISEALRKAREREVGGVLMAEHVGPNEFVLRDVTIHRRGLLARFVRQVGAAWRGLNDFFQRTGHNYTRFNYIGEWHSHPQFELIPSPRDRAAMVEIVSDPTAAPTFAVLLIVKLDPRNLLVGSLHTYLPDGSEHASELVL